MVFSDVVICTTPELHIFGGFLAFVLWCERDKLSLLSLYHSE